ncbi:MAG: sporulation protein YqfD [Clostridia bacterium]|nr:sporulation protein YqfD [Clostridia bacterium]
MFVTVCIEGINLEKLLREASRAGLLIRSASRKGMRSMRLCVRAKQMKLLEELCARSGWTCTVVREGGIVRLIRFLRERPVFVPAMALSALLVWLSSQMILRIRIVGAKESEAQVRHVLAAENVQPGRFKAALSLDMLRAALAHKLPGLAYAGAYYEGSTLVIDCHPAREGESLRIAGDGEDIVAARSGIISRIWVSSGTPLVEPGQAVRKGQVLIAGYERREKGSEVPVTAQGQVYARVYLGGEAKASLTETRSVETGQTRTRVTLATPWHRRVVRDCAPYESQDTSREIQRVVGLYLPLWREIETYAQLEVFSSTRSRSDAASMAQGAAEKIAKEQCPPGALILDKWVNYSMIDNEFVYASVVLEAEASIAGRVR